ncbi:MAG TPA: DUF192 domain-containing protein [Candidatus Dormibacteraeota bacterium]|nr:DUF192 domain-containing protein [Candidatus Dormibacteraeota bacterium]
MNRLRSIALLLTVGLLIALASACNKPTPAAAAPAPAAPAYPQLPTKAQAKLPTTKLWLGAEEMVAELALDDTSRMTGMMFRTNMPENEGMLFVFPLPHRTSFWMKNTKIPLSAAYINPDGVILEIHALEPENTNSVEAASDQIQYVLETKQGWFQRHNVNTGAVVRTEIGPLRSSFTQRQR